MKKVKKLARFWLEKSWVQALLLFLFALLFYSSWHHAMIFNIYQGRDIRRAMEILNGHWIWYGPDVSGGGHTPGPFYYWFLALPYAIFGTWQSLVWLNIVLMSASAVVLWFTGVAMGSRYSGFLLYLLFLNSQILSKKMAAFWNPSFLFIFQAIMLYWVYKFPNKKNYLIATALLLGFSIQIHYLQIVFVIAMLAAIVFSKEKSQEKRKNLALAGGLFILPLVPYFLWSLLERSGKSTHELSGGLSTLVFPLVNLFKNTNQAANLFQTNLNLFFEEQLSRDVVLPLLIVTWGFAILRFRKDKPPFSKSIFLWTAFVLSIVASLPLIQSIHFDRYTEPLFLLFYVMSVPLIEWFEKKYPHVFLASLTIAVLYSFFHFQIWRHRFDFFIPTLLFMVFATLLVVSFQLKENQRFVVGILFVPLFWGYLVRLSHEKTEFGRKIDMRAFERTEVNRTIAEKTGWDFKTFRERTFIIGMHREAEFQIPYNQVLATTSQIKETFDGALVFNRTIAGFLENNKPNWQKIRDYIPDEIFSAGASKQLACNFTKSVGIFDICLYKFEKAGSHFLWNNLGYPYVYQQPPLLTITEGQGVQKTEEGWLFYKNECANFEPACSIYFLVSPSKNSLDVTVLGDPLAMPNPAPNPAWYLSLKNLQLETVCPNGDREVARISTHFGIEPRPGDLNRNGFLTPYKTRVPLKCKNPKLLAVVANDKGFSASTYGTRRLNPRFRIEWKKQ